MRIFRIVSGGQTGADRAALDWAIEDGVLHGGWCPAGRRAEDGVIPHRYVLTETPGRNYQQRTRWNVLDSDGTLIVSLSPELRGGSAATRDTAERFGNPWLHIHQGSGDVGEAVRAFVKAHRIRVLNVAGPRLSSEPGIEDIVKRVLSPCDVQAEVRRKPSCALGRAAPPSLRQTVVAKEHMRG